jgi:hypothetical protein
MAPSNSQIKFDMDPKIEHFEAAPRKLSRILDRGSSRRIIVSGVSDFQPSPPRPRSHSSSEIIGSFSFNSETPSPTNAMVLKNNNFDFTRIVYEFDNRTLKRSLSKPITTDESTQESHASFVESTDTLLGKEKPKQKQSGTNQLLIKLGILFSRSSGRDKFCALLQYGAMFWGNQKIFSVSSARDAPWRNLEESMSAGRKTLRLFKWTKEFERMQRSLAFPDPGPHASEARTKVASALGFFMHTFSFAYYFVDNVLYMSQIGLINNPDVTGIFELRKMLKSGLSHDEYQRLQSKFRSDEVLRGNSRMFEGRLRDWKNYASLFRLLTAIAYCSLQIDSVNSAEERLQKQTEMADKQRVKRAMELTELKEGSINEVIASICNLAILLQRLGFPVFKRLPLWSIGVFGIIAAGFGLEKNWPQAQAERTKSVSN